MDQQRWQQIDKIFQEAAELGVVEREAFLEQACGQDTDLNREVRSMLNAMEEENSFFDTPLIKEHSLEAGDRIGPYAVIRELGRGGMGVVYLAEQREPITRRVAIKLTTFQVIDQEVMKRFEIEQRLLARMNHSHVARIYDSGIDGSLPYFVMEYVEGLPITTYCDHHKLDIDQRLDLFSKVCAGVSHAHLKGIIHRDIKPSNILVVEEDGQPIPKIIDFGIARCLNANDGLTRQGISPGTFRYMSPEQAGLTDQAGHALDLDPRTDVYSLGVLLYELLVGQPPLMWTEEVPVMRICTEICNRVPLRPSIRFKEASPEQRLRIAQPRNQDVAAVQRRLNGELDWIVSRALEKDPERRYRSPGDLADELTRLKQGQPVLAGPPGLRYLFSKFFARHKVLVSLMIGVLLMVVGFVLALIQEQKRTVRERDRAEQQLMRSQQLKDLFVDLFHSADPRQENDINQTVKEFMSGAAERVPESLKEQPLVRAELLATLGQVQNNLGLTNESKSLIKESLELRRQYGATDSEIIESLTELGKVKIITGEIPEALKILEEAYSLGPELLTPGDQVRLFSNLGICHFNLNQIEEAESWYARCEQIREQHEIPAEVEAKLHTRLSMLAAYKLDYELAISFIEPGIDKVIKAYGDHSLSLVSLYERLSEMYKRLGDFEKMTHYACLFWNIVEHTFGKDEADYAYYLGIYGRTRSVMGHFTTALDISLEVEDLYRQHQGDDYFMITFEMTTQAFLLSHLGMHERAESLVLYLHERWSSQFGADDMRTVYTYDLHCELAHRAGDYEKALSLWEKAQPFYESTPGSQIRGDLIKGRILKDLGELDEAEALLQPVFEGYLRDQPTNFRLTTLSLDLGQIHQQRGDHEKAKPFLDKAMSTSKQKFDLDNQHGEVFWPTLIDAYRAGSFMQEAVEATKHLIALRAHQLGKDHVMTKDAQQLLARLENEAN